MNWFVLIGLILDFTGAVILVSDLIVTRKEAIEHGTAKWGGSTEEEKLKQKAVIILLKQSRKAVLALCLLALGFLLQIAGIFFSKCYPT